MHGEGSRGRRVDTMGEGQVPGVGALSLKGVKAIGRMKDRPTNRHTNTENSASADGGPRSRVCARETLCSTPIDTKGNLPAHMSIFSPNQAIISTFIFFKFPKFS